MTTKFRIDPEFAECMFGSTSECDEELERDLLEHGGPRDKLLVGVLPDVEPFLVDGHRRFRICEKHDLPYEVEIVAFQTREQVFDFIDHLAMSRRNLPANQLALIRGRLQQRQQAALGNVGQSVTATAKATGVSERTVYRDAAYTAAVEKIPPAFRERVVREMSQQATIDLAWKPPEEQVKILEAADKPVKPPKASKTDKKTFAGSMKIVSKSVVQIQNQLEDVHRCVADAIRLKTAKGMAKGIARQLDGWGESHGQ
jgi:hypothetical protein